MSYISKWRLQNNSVVPVGSNLFGTCNSGSSDTTKVVSLSAFNVLVEGVTIHVYFANANSGSNTLLQVGSTSAQPIKRNGVAEGKWESGSVISFTYSQGYWVQNDADVGGGGGETYILSKSGDTITLTGSGGDTSSVTDDNTTYTFALYGGNLVISGSDGSQQAVPIPDNDTTYELENNLETITHMLYVNLDGAGYDASEDNFVVNNNGVEYLVGDHQVYIVDSDGNDITGISTYNLRWTGTQTDAYTFGQNLYNYFATHNAYRLKIDGVLTQKITKYGTYYDLTEALPDYDRVTAKEWVHQGTGGDVFGVTAQGVVLGNKSTIDLVGSDGTTSSVNLKAIDIGALPTAQYHVNDATHSGYVKSPSGLPGIRVWKTDETGEPGWRLENGDTTYTISISGNVITLTPSSGTAQTITLPIPSPTTTTPIMDGTADVGSETNYARGDHVHPSDTSKQDTLVSGTNIKTINGNSILGSGNLTTPDDDTTYTFSISGNTLTITDSDGNTQTITLPSGGGEHIELTQAQYNALPQSEKDDPNKVYFITDGTPFPQSFIDAIYPVGSYYETSDSTFDPNVSWGGTWVLETEGQVHVSAGANYDVGDTGGEATHTLIVNEMPSHNHAFRFGGTAFTLAPDSAETTAGFTSAGTGGLWGNVGKRASGNTMNTTGNNQAHNNMQPYIVVNRWHRTA